MTEWMGTGPVAMGLINWEGLSEWLIGWAGLIFGFSWLIFIHEMGHFLLAKWNGVHVHVFSIGMGPYVVSFTRGEKNMS